MQKPSLFEVTFANDTKARVWEFNEQGVRFSVKKQKPYLIIQSIALVPPNLAWSRSNMAHQPVSDRSYNPTMLSSKEWAEFQEWNKESKRGSIL